MGLEHHELEGSVLLMYQCQMRIRSLYIMPSSLRSYLHHKLSTFVYRCLFIMTRPNGALHV